MLSGDKPISDMTVAELRDMMLLHARASKSRSLSYQDVAALIGRLGFAVAGIWWLLGFPGAPKVHHWWWKHLVPHETLAEVAVVGLAVVLIGLDAFRRSVRCPPGLRGPLGVPKELVGELLHAARLLIGIAAIGVAAIVPGAYVVYVLKLNSP